MALPAIDFCDQYLQISDELNCSHKSHQNYFVHFGYKYCRKFIEKNSSFTIDGQEKLDQIRNCLIDELKLNRQLTCQNSMELGYKSHVKCYIENGYCEMNTRDISNIFLVTFPEVIQKEYFPTALKIRSHCQ